MFLSFVGGGRSWAMSNECVVFRTNHSMFEYKVIDMSGQPDVSYIDTPLQNCFVEEILVQITKTLTTVLPPQFGFFPTAAVSCC